MLVYGRKKEDLLTCTLSDETNELLSALDMMPSLIGNIVDFELNKILRECEAIIFKSAGLYEEGYFDCAFYLLRQVWELTLKIHEDFATGSIDVDLAKKCLGDKEFGTIKKLDIYKDTFETFNARTPVNSCTLCVTQKNFFHMEQLDHIWKDKGVLCGCAFQIIRILKSGIAARKFMSSSFDSFYYTSIVPENKRFDLCVSSDFEPYISIADNYNISHGKRYISKVVLYGEMWFIEHDKFLNEEQIEFIKNMGSESQEDIFEKQNDRILTEEEKEFMKTILEMVGSTD